MGKTLFDKVWDAHVVRELDGGRSVLYIDRHYIHEVTSPVAFLGLKNRGLKVARPAQTTGTPDHNVPTVDQHLPVAEEQSRNQLDSFRRNCEENGIEYFPLGNPGHGIVHIIGPEQGFTQPGMTIVCGDSHTSTHGAFGAVAFGIGTSEVEMVFASQCILQPKPKTMRITVNGKRKAGVTAKDIILYVISKISASGGTGHFIEFAGEAIRDLSMEERMTVCNMSIECGARGGMIAPDQTTFDYVKGRKHAPQGTDFDKAVGRWKQLYSDPDARFDTEYTFDAADIEPMITFGTNPGMGVAVTAEVPSDTGLSGSDRVSFGKALAKAEGLDKILADAGFVLRQPGCSACLAMNADKIPAGKYSVSTSNRNFEGRQGPGARTMLAGPLVAAAAAVTGCIADPREVFGL